MRELGCRHVWSLKRLTGLLQVGRKKLRKGTGHKPTKEVTDHNAPDTAIWLLQRRDAAKANGCGDARGNLRPCEVWVAQLGKGVLRQRGQGMRLDGRSHFGSRLPAPLLGLCGLVFSSFLLAAPVLVLGCAAGATVVHSWVAGPV